MGRARSAQFAVRSTFVHSLRSPDFFFPSFPLLKYRQRSLYLVATSTEPQSGVNQSDGASAEVGDEGEGEFRALVPD